MIPSPVPAKRAVIVPGATNAAATLLADPVVTGMTHDVPVHAPVNSRNVEVPLAARASVTLPTGNTAVQVPDATPPVIVHVIPDGVDVTVPFPVLTPVTVMLPLATAVNTADTVRATLIGTTHGVVVHAPPQPVNVEEAPGAADRVTEVPGAKSAAQVPDATPAVTVQLTPAGDEVIVPLPVPLEVTVSRSGTSPKLVVTALVVDDVTVTAHGDVVQAPLTVPRLEPAAGVAVSVTLPGGNAAEHVPLATPAVMVQLMPAGADATVPVPRPAPATVIVPATGAAVNTTLAARAALIVTWQGLPVQSPPQLVKVDVPPAAAVSVTTALAAKSAAQVPLATPAVTVQLMPAGDDVTEPLPVPDAVSVSRRAARPKVVVTALVDDDVTVTAHGDVVQAPASAASVEPLAGVAVRVTLPGGNAAEHVPLATPSVMAQVMPAGADVTVPVPRPAPATVIVPGAGGAVNATVAVAGAASVTTHGLPTHAPPHPVKVELPPGAAVSVTAVPAAKSAAQVPLATPAVRVQLIPVGADVTVPDPLPLPVRVSRVGRGAIVAVAVALLPADPLTAQLTAAPVAFPVAVQAPATPETVEAPFGVTVSVMAVSLGKVPVQVPVAVPPATMHVMPAGALRIDAPPVPVTATVNEKVARSNRTPTDCAADIVTVQLEPLAVLQAPVQPATRWPSAGVAVSVMAELAPIAAVQFPELDPPLVVQSIPPLDETRRPAPVPPAVAARLNVVGGGGAGGAGSGPGHPASSTLPAPSAIVRRWRATRCRLRPAEASDAWDDRVTRSAE